DLLEESLTPRVEVLSERIERHPTTVAGDRRVLAARAVGAPPVGGDAGARHRSRLPVAHPNLRRAAVPLELGGARPERHEPPGRGDLPAARAAGELPAAG